MSDRLEINDVSHAYGGGGQLALRDVSLSLAEGEFMTFLGPSGCGKTTLLRIIAGFLHPTKGSVTLGGGELTGVPANKRPVNMVFQRPTLFPHLDVFGNVAFGLKVDRVPKGEIAKRVHETLELVQLVGYEHRRADELSGGQMQRVALARALVKQPGVLLLDEPLSALDLKVRLEMEAELRRMHRETGATFVYVTHDQREAMALSDRIAVFDSGRMVEVAEPTELYGRPKTVFAARFVGDSNVMAVQVRSREGDRASVTVAGVETHARCEVEGIGSGAAWLGVRPEVVSLTADRNDPGTLLRGTVSDVAYRGTGFAYEVDVPELDRALKAEVSVAGGGPHEVGAAVGISWPADAAWVLAGDEQAAERAAEAEPTDAAWQTA